MVRGKMSTDKQMTSVRFNRIIETMVNRLTVTSYLFKTNKPIGLSIAIIFTK